MNDMQAPVSGTQSTQGFRFPKLPPAIWQLEWPFYLDCEALTLLERIRERWGEDCTIQIYGGRIRIVAEHGQMEFLGIQELLNAFACLNAEVIK